MSFEKELLGGGGGRAAAEQDSAIDPGRFAGAAFIEGMPLGGGYGGGIFSDLANLGGDMAFDVNPGEMGGEMGPTENAEAASQVAQDGFQGTPKSVPHRELMERTFGVDFSSVEAFTGDAANAANAAFGAAAYADGNRVAFGSENPDPSLVAHELTHVLQQSDGRDKDAGASGIARSGEAQAEAVEGAVKAGKPAAAALDSDPRKRAVKKGPGKPALSSPWTSGMTFSPNGLEQSGSYTIWSGRGIRIPIAAVPGLFFTVSPAVSVGVGGGVDWTKKAVTARATVDGSVAAGLSYGDPALAEIYANMEAGAQGGFTYERTKAQAPTTGNQSGSPGGSRPRDQWSLTGAITLQTAFNVGVKLGGGIIEKKFQFGQCEIGKLTGLAWQNGVFKRNQVGWTWGAMPTRFFNEVKSLINRAKQIMNLPAEAAKKAWEGMSDGAGWVFNGAKSLVGKLDPRGWF
jgi:Domain of unknown function (DUF4157)